MITRRTLLTGLAALVAAPAINRTPGILMPVKAFEPPPRFSEIVYRVTYRWSDDNTTEQDFPLSADFVARLNAGLQRGDTLTEWIDAIAFQHVNFVPDPLLTYYPPV